MYMKPYTYSLYTFPGYIAIMTAISHRWFKVGPNFKNPGIFLTI